MATVINMPRLSDTMTEGTVASWLKKVGDRIEEGDILAEIETDKATMEFESFNEGTLLYIGVQEGDSAPVDSLLAIIGEEGENVDALVSGGAAPEVVAQEETPVAPVTEAAAPAAAPAVEMPSNLTVVTMPRLSDTMTDGTVATWLKHVGDQVQEGDILAEIETDKATMEFESFNEGTLLYVGLKEGESAPVDSILAIIGEQGADVDAALAAFNASHGEAPQAEPTATKQEEAPKAAAPAPKAAATATAPQAVKAEVVNTGRIVASPLAKKIAQEKGINLATVQGTGEHGRIIKKDVEFYNPVVNAPAAPAAEVKTFAPAGEPQVEEIKNSQMRKTIARRLSESKFSAPHYYLTIDINMDEAINSRKAINSIPDTKVSFNDLVVKASAMALKKHPQVNSQWTDNNTIINHHVNIGVAVAVEDGLVVPVIPFTDTKSLTSIGAEVKELAIKAKTKKLQPKEMEGSTFTVSNLGMFGISEFTSIINQPNSAILSVGAISQQPVVKNGEIVVGNIMKVTLACDHRTVDGATGAQFLQTLKSFVENPVTMLA
ncbi:MAG: pyruvate dehydrogenase complex dihydrolipoamide acetyltransferase [Flavobacteriaceae bacterium]